MNDRIGITITAEDLASKDIDELIRKFKELDRVIDGTTGNQRSRERIQNTKAESAANTAKSREAVANTNREKQADTNRSREAVANINLEKTTDTNRSREAVANTRREQNAESIRSREKITNINTETAQQRIQGQAESRRIQDRRLAEQRLAREQRDRHFRMRQQQREVSTGFNNWGSALGTVAGILGGELLLALNRVARRAYEVTRNFEQIRLGLAAFEGSQLVADADLAAVRELARLPNVQFEGAARGFQSLRSAGLDRDLSLQTIRELSNVVAIAGRTQQDVNRAIYFFQQMVGLQQFRNEELRQLYEISGALRRSVTQTFGTAQGDEITKVLEERGLSFNQGMQLLLNNLGDTVRAPTTTLANKVENLNESFDDLLRDIGRDLTPTLKVLVDALKGLTEFLRSNRTALYGGLAGAGLFGIQELIGYGGPAGEARRRSREARRTYGGRRPSRWVEYGTLGALGGGGYTGIQEFSSRLRAGELGVVRPDGSTQTLSQSNLTRPTPGAGPHTQSLMDQVTEERAQARQRAADAAARRGRFSWDPRQIRLPGGGGRFGRAAANIGVGFGIGIGVDLIANLIHGPEGESELKQATQRTIQATKVEVERLANQRGELEAALKRWNEEIVKTIETGTITAGSLRSISADSQQLLQPFIKLQNDFEKQIVDYNARINTAVTTADGRQLFELTGSSQVTEEQNRSLKELSGRQQVRIRALIDERKAVIATTEALKNMIAETNKTTTAIERSRKSVRDEVKPRPGFNEAITGVSRGPIRSGEDPFPSVLTITGEGRRPVQRPPIGPGFQLEGSDDLNRAYREGGVIQGHTEAWRAYSTATQEAAESSRQVQRAVLESTEAIKTATGSDVLSQGLNLPTGSETANMLLNPSRINDLRAQARNLTNQWKEHSRVLNEVLVLKRGHRQIDDFTLKQLIAERDELQKYRTQLSSVLYQFEQLGGVPEALGAEMTAAFEQSANALEKLNEKIRVLQKRAANPAMNKMFDSLGNLTKTRTDQIPETQQAIQLSQLPSQVSGQVRPSDLALSIERHITGSGESLYDQFIAPSILDFVGIGSGRTAARERNIEDLKRSINQAQEDIKNNTTLNERDKAEQLLEINREYQREKRQIERQYEEERSDAWANWVRQQLTDIPLLIFQQLKLQLSARATNEILNALGIGGNRLPIQGGGGLFDRIGGLFGRGGTAAATTQYSAPIGPGLSGAQTAGGVGLGGTAATAGTALSVALAAHNIGTAIVPQWNPHGTSAFDIVGEDLASVVVDPMRSFFESFHFNNPMNDDYALRLGRERAMVELKNLTTTASRYGRESAVDLANNYDKGMAQVSDPAGNQPQGNFYMVPENAEIKIVNTVGDREVRELTLKMGDMFHAHRLDNPFSGNSGRALRD